MEHCDTQIYGAITGTYACTTKSDIQKYGFKGGIFEYIYISSEYRFRSYRHQVDEYKLLLCVFPYSELCQTDYLD